MILFMTHITRLAYKITLFETMKIILFYSIHTYTRAPAHLPRNTLFEYAHVVCLQKATDRGIIITITRITILRATHVFSLSCCTR